MIGFRDITRATDTRTFIAAYLPEDIGVSNHAPLCNIGVGEGKSKGFNSLLDYLVGLKKSGRMQHLIDCQRWGILPITWRPKNHDWIQEDNTSN